MSNKWRFVAHVSHNVSNKWRFVGHVCLFMPNKWHFVVHVNLSTNFWISSFLCHFDAHLLGYIVFVERYHCIFLLKWRVFDNSIVFFLWKNYQRVFNYSLNPVVENL